MSVLNLASKHGGPMQAGEDSGSKSPSSELE